MHLASACNQAQAAKAGADEGASEKHYYVRVSKKDHYYQTLIVPIFLTDPYIVVIADRGRGEREGETLSWSEGEERERGRQVWGEGNKTQKSVEGGSVAEKHATLASISSRYEVQTPERQSRNFEERGSARETTSLRKYPLLRYTSFKL